MDVLIPSAFGLEAVVKRQLSRLSYDGKAIDGRILIGGLTENDVARLNVFLRSGERVLIRLAVFSARTFDDVYEAVYEYPWQDLMPVSARVLVDVKSVNSTLCALKATGSVMKKAIMTKLGDFYRASTCESGSRYIVSLSIRDDEATLCLDTSGDGLHKRGYRDLAYCAPLKETTAAALIDLTVFAPDKPFADLFCGSGTLPIEAAMIARGIAPGLNRDFDCGKWSDSYAEAIRQAKREARESERKNSPVIYACDIDPEAVSIARRHAKRARVSDCIEFEVADMRKFRSDLKYGVICSNPPYGERIGEEKQVLSLYHDLRKVVDALNTWSAYVLTSHPLFEREYGKPADKRRKIFNANLCCQYYSFLGPKPPKRDQ